MEKEQLIELVKKSQSGDTGAIEKLLQYAHTSVSYQCRKMLNNEQDAEDMTQEVLLAIYTKLDTLQEPAAFWKWANQITATRCINALNRTHVEYQFAEDEEGHSILDNLEELDEQVIPDKAIDNAETARMIEEIVEGLPDAQRAATLMFYFDEMSVKEIAKTMKVSENTVKSRLNYARKAIKEKVLDYEKQGVKLYGLSPLPFLLYFLRLAAKLQKDDKAAGIMVAEVMAGGGAAVAAGASVAGAAVAAGASVAGAAVAAGTSVAGGAVAAGTSVAGTGSAAAVGAGAATATAATAAAATATGTTAAAGILASVSAKVVAGILAAVVMVGGVAAAVIPNMPVDPAEPAILPTESATVPETEFISETEAPATEAATEPAETEATEPATEATAVPEQTESTETATEPAGSEPTQAATEGTDSSDDSESPTCASCGIGKIRVVILAQATCDLRGEVIGQCDHCGYIAGRSFPPAMGHSMVAGVCTVCGATETTCEHFYDSGVANYPAGPNNFDPYMLYTCTLCGHTYTVPIE